MLPMTGSFGGDGGRLRIIDFASLSQIKRERRRIRDGNNAFMESLAILFGSSISKFDDEILHQFASFIALRGSTEGLGESQIVGVRLGNDKLNRNANLHPLRKIFAAVIFGRLEKTMAWFLTISLTVSADETSKVDFYPNCRSKREPYLPEVSEEQWGSLPS
ncbi:hypothetical protein F3Y22_tig00110020pilonHSYRG00281 [Hibiscus syriacus]|uniref:Uncharacterized protein n=1 Tax=Hibiscus syriacus TaxID=106335 RepID=A0A6A3BMU6_HIBSY|nr:hypothetical protein F3Y22_tig00110020pilonHSYRG00281 [Hibiscus syriacus]